MRAALEPPDDFRRRLLARELAEKLFDVLNLERALLEIVLRDVIFHDPQLTTRFKIADLRFKIGAS